MNFGMRWRCIALACLALGVLAATASARGAHPIRVEAHSSSGTSAVRMWATVRTQPTTRCWGSAAHAGKRLELPRVTTFSNGEAEWRWQIARGTSAGRWTIRVRCWLTSGHRTASTRVSAAGLPGSRRTSGLAVRGSLRPVGDKSGTGGGGRNLYPLGECTWWAQKLRPDLPWFPDRTGEALNWAYSAAKRGFPVDGTPEAGAVVVFQPGQYGAARTGHVAYVTAVDGPRIWISESGWRDFGAGHVREVEWSGLSFIHKKDRSRDGGGSGGGDGDQGGGGSDGRTPPEIYTHHVHHTCANNRCGLKLHTGPGYTRYLSHALLPDGTTIEIRCQTTGERVTGADGTSSDVWDRLADGRYVSDYFVDTPGMSGALSPPIPLCAGAPPDYDRTTPFFTYHVNGTCADGLCGLRERTEPGYAAYPVTAIFMDGTPVNIVCQTTGDSVGNTTVWNRLSDDFYVSDFYVDTPGGSTGLTFTDSIPRC